MQDGFHGPRVAFDEKRCEQWVETFVQGVCRTKIILVGEVDNFLYFSWYDVGGNADDAACTDAHEGQGQAVVATQDGVFGAELLAQP